MPERERVQVPGLEREPELALKKERVPAQQQTLAPDREPERELVQAPALEPEQEQA